MSIIEEPVRTVHPRPLPSSIGLDAGHRVLEPRVRLMPTPDAGRLGGVPAALRDHVRLPTLDA